MADDAQCRIYGEEGEFVTSKMKIRVQGEGMWGQQLGQGMGTSGNHVIGILGMLSTGSAMPVGCSCPSNSDSRIQNSETYPCRPCYSSSYKPDSCHTWALDQYSYPQPQPANYPRRAWGTERTQQAVSNIPQFNNWLESSPEQTVLHWDCILCGARILGIGAIWIIWRMLGRFLDALFGVLAAVIIRMELLLWSRMVAVFWLLGAGLLTFMVITDDYNNNTISYHNNRLVPLLITTIYPNSSEYEYRLLYQQYHQYKQMQCQSTHPPTALRTHLDPTTQKQALPHLLKLSKKQLKPAQIIECLSYFYSLTQTYRSYAGNCGKFDYRTLAKLYQKELVDFYGVVAGYVLEYWDKNRDDCVPILWANQEKEVTLAKSDVLLILCLMTLMLMPVQVYQQHKQHECNFNHLKNFSYIFTNIQFKTTSIIQYLSQQLPTHTHNPTHNPTNSHQLTLTRRVVRKYQPPNTLEQIIEEHGGKGMSQCIVEDDGRDIEEFYGEVKVDFSNKYVGGGALTFGAVQEEIMFAVHPQMYVSMVMCQKMQQNESIQYKGFHKYLQSTGYNHNVTITGLNPDLQPNSHQSKTPHIPQQYITAIDAINFNRQHQLEQYSEQSVLREVVKAYAGFLGFQGVATVVTGNWGCGVFGGDVQVKLLVQWIAATMAGKRIRYCPYGSRDKVYHQVLLTKLSKLQLSTVLKLLIKSVTTLHKTPQKTYNLRSNTHLHLKPTPTVYSQPLSYLI